MDIDDGHEYCYVEDKEVQYKIVRIVQKDADPVSGAVSYTCQDVIQRPGGAAPFKVGASKTHPLSTKEDLLDPPQDLVLMAVVNNPGILEAVRSRFLKDEIYTSIGSILINMNPFKWIKGLYETSVMEKYRDGLHVMGQQPHVFAIACRAHEGLVKGANQSIIISGESGAGKTEATKQCLSYLAHCAGGTSDIQAKILKTSPILEAWGNAKTIRNNNSSRFGKFIEVWFNDNFTIRGASNTTYLLEKNRVIFQNNGERNYHIFYQLLFGASSDLLKALKLQEMAAIPNTAKYIAGATKIDDVDDAKDFVELMRAFEELGFDSEHIEVLFRALAGILHMGNVSYVSNPQDSEQCLVGEDRIDWLGRAADMWGLDAGSLRKGLLAKTVQAGGAGKRGSVTMKAFNLAAAYQNKDAIVKEVYGRCFDYIVRTINDELGAGKSSDDSSMIGVLDIFGFEIFPNNSFEQLCINLANESLQQHFNFNIFRAEMELYKSEDIAIPKLDFQDNQDVLDLIIKRRQGLFAMLDDECLVPKGDWNGFYNKITKQFSAHPRFLVSKTMGHDFTIKHYAGDVAYDPSLFLLKNKDAVSEDLIEILRASKIPFISQLFTSLGDDGEDESLSRGTLVTAAAAKATVGKKFVKQLEDLMVALNKTSSQYVRCVKANHVKKPNIFDCKACYEQLNYSGVFEAVIIMKKGYPFRLKLEQFRQRFHLLVETDHDREAIFDLTPVWNVFPAPLQKQYPPVSRDYCQRLIDIVASKAPDLSSIHVGRSLVFYRSEQNIVLERMRRDKLLPAVRRVQRMFRGALSFRLVSRALLARRNCEEADIDTDVGRLRSMAKELIDAGSRLRRATGCIIDMEMGFAVAKYADALTLEQEVISELTPILASRQALMDNYHKIEDIMGKIALINFRTTVRGKTFAVEVDDNPVLVKASAIIKKHTSIFKLKKGLDEGIKDKDELQLQSALRRLRQLQIEGIIDQNFCMDEIFLANDIVKHGVSQLNKFLDTAGAALSAGRLRSSREGAAALHVVADPSPLASFIASQRARQAEPAALSKMVQAFLSTCDKVCSLRALVQKGAWRELWQLLQASWRSYLFSSGLPSALDKIADVPFIPESLEALFRDEVANAFLCCIELELVPRLLAAAAAARPAVQIDVDQGSCSQAPVREMLAELEPFEKYFDSGLLVSYKSTQELLSLRDAVVSNSGPAIEAALLAVRLLPREHPEYVFAAQNAAYYSCVTTLCQSLCSDGPAGSAGSLTFSREGLPALAAALAEAEAVPCSNEMWRRLLAASAVILQLRSLLSQGDIDAATAFLAGVNLSAFPWVRLRSSVVSRSSSAVEESVSAALVKGNREIDQSTKELNHRRAVKELLAAARTDALRGEIGGIANIAELSGAALRAALQSGERLLVHTEESTALLRDCRCLLLLRDSVSAGDWAAAERTIVPFYADTLELEKCLPALRPELRLFYDEVFDLKIRTKIIDALSSDQIQCDENNCVSNSRVETGALVDALEIRGGHLSVSFETKYIALTAKIVCAMRQSVYENRWEPDGFMSHDIAMRDFVEFASLLDKSYPKAEAKIRLRHQKVAQDIADMARLSVPSSEVMSTEVEAFDVECNWFMCDLLAFASNVGVHPSGAAEVESIRRVAYERRLRFMLLLAAASGRVDGSIDNLHVSCVEYDQLIAALNYAQTYAHFASPVVHNWQAAAHELLHSRMAVKSAYGGDGPRCVSDSGTRQLVAYLDTRDIKRVIVETEGYPTYELRLIMDYVTDQLHLREVMECLHFGQASPASGFLIDHRLVEYRNLTAVVAAGYLSAVISTKLQKILMYSEVVIKLRKLIKDNQWCFEDVTLFAHVGHSMCDRLQKTLGDWDAMNAHYVQEFGEDKEVPPACVVQEFRFVRLETQKLASSLELNSLLADGGVSGAPLGLLLSPVDTAALQRALASTSKRFRAHELRGSVLELLSLAGHEAVGIHEALLALRLRYLREAVPAGAKGVQAEVRAAGVEQAISAAVDNVARLCSGPYSLLTEWRDIDQLVARAEHARLLRSEGLDRALDLLVAEGFVRTLVADALGMIDPIVADFNRSYLQRAAPPFVEDVGGSPAPRNLARLFDGGSAAVEAVVNQLHVLCLHYETLNSRGVPDSVKLLVGRCPLARVVYHSLVLLMHLLRAEQGGLYEPLHRGWEGAELEAPRMEDLRARRLDGSYSLQALLRRAAKTELNSKLAGVAKKLAASVHDEVSYKELSEAAAEGQARGDLQGLDLGAISTEPLLAALSRAEALGAVDAGVLRLLQACRCLHELRAHVKAGRVAEAFEALDDHLGGGGRSVAAVLGVVYGARFRAPPEVADEFSRLSFYICDRYWQLLAEYALLSDGFSGHRFISNIASVTWTRLDAALALLDVHTCPSHHSRKLGGLCHGVRRLRCELVSGADPVELHHCDEQKPALRLPGRSGSVPPSRRGQLAALGALAGDCIRCWNDCQTEAGVETGEDSASMQFLTEMILVEEHCVNVSSGVDLEAALGVQLLWFSPSGGLQYLPPVLANLLPALQAAEQLKWRRDSLGSLESWWLLLLRAARKVAGVGALVDASGAQALRPGTDAFAAVEAQLSEARAALGELVNPSSPLQQAVNAHGMYALPPTLPSLHRHLSSALVEHANVVKLKRYLLLDSVSASASNGAGRFDLEVLLGASTEFARAADLSDYDSFVEDYCAAVEAVPVATIYGQAAQHLTLLHAKLLQAVHWRRYDEVLATAALIMASDLFLLRPAHVDLVAAHCSLLRKARVLERALLCCLLPCVPGWSRLAAAPLLAHAINDAPVTAALAAVSGEELACCGPLKGLALAAELLLLLVAAVRAGAWLAPSAQAGPRDLFAQQLQQRYPAAALPRAEATSAGQSVEQACASLRAACSGEQCSELLSAGMKEYLEEVAALAEKEVAALRLEEEAAEVFARCGISGSAGQLLFSAQAAAALQRLEERLAGPHAADGFYEVARARQSARLLRRAIELLARAGGTDLAALADLVRLMEVLAVRAAPSGEEQLCEQHMQGRLEHASTLLASEGADLDEYLSRTLDNARSGQHYLQDLIVAAMAAETTSRSADFGAVSAACEACLGEGVAGAYRLRPELSGSLLLLRSHLVFMQQHACLCRAVLDTPAAGTPGALDCSAVKVADLGMLVDTLESEAADAGPSLLGPAWALLHSTAQCMYMLRCGQRASNVDRLRSGVQALEVVRKQELAYLSAERAPLAGLTRAPLEPMAFLLLFEGEASLSAADLQERDLLALLSEGVCSRGASLGDTDEGSALYQTELAAALAACERSAPQSAQGLLLQRTAAALAPLREMVVKRRWLHLVERVDTADIAAIAPAHVAEVYAAMKTGYVNYAVGRARKAYANGSLKRLKVASRKDVVVDFVSGELDDGPAQDAVECFNRVRDEWHTASTLEHRDTCRLLYTLRLEARKGSWLAVLDTARFALDEHRLVARPVAAEGLAEVRFALELAAHRVSCEALRGALAAGGCSGTVGEADTSNLSPTVLRVALDLSRALGSAHAEVRALEAAAQTVLALREAQLCGRWVRSDTLLGGRPYETVERMVALAVLGTDLLPDRLRSSYYSAEVEEEMDYSTYGVRRQRVEEGSGGRGDASRTVRAMLDATIGGDHDLLFAYGPGREGQLPSVEQVLAAAAPLPVAEAQEELAFARAEVDYRRLVVGLVAAIRTHGISGEPGAVVATGIHTRELEEAIAAAQANAQLSSASHCKYLLRDAVLLLRLRQAYAGRAWRSLSAVVREAEEKNKASKGEQHRAALPLLLPVWNEVKLVKAELSFQLLYVQFARLCATTRREVEGESRGDAASASAGGEKEDISELMRALIAAEGAAQHWPSQHFDRLIEAINLALELRVYKAFNSNSSPKEILRRATEIKLRDQSNGDVCYTSLLFNEIAEVETTSTKVQLLAALAEEVADGQKYLLCPLGGVNSQEVDTEKLHLFLQSVEPLINVLWTPQDRLKLALAGFIARVRDCIRARDWPAALQMVQSCPLSYQGSAIETEMERVAFEIENSDACRDLDSALGQGRFLDLVFIAKKISANRRRSSIAASEGKPSRRMSQLPSEFDACLAQLQRALEAAQALKKRSMLVNNFVTAGTIVFEMRSEVGMSRWREVEALVAQALRLPTLPRQSIEEFGAVRAGLQYRSLSSKICEALLSGPARRGKDGGVDFTTVSTGELQGDLSLFHSTIIACGTADASARLFHDLASRVCTLRRAVLQARFLDEDLPVPVGDRTLPEELSVEYLLPLFPTAGGEGIAELRSALGIGDEIALMSAEEVVVQSHSDWILRIWLAVGAVLEEVRLLSADVLERRQRLSVVAALETYPPVVQLLLSSRALVAADADDPNRVAPLRRALEPFLAVGEEGEDAAVSAASAAEAIYSEDMARLLCSAKLALRFRMALNGKDLATFESLLALSDRLAEAGELSDTYGVLELRAYRAVTTTGELAREQLVLLLAQGRVRGFLDSAFVHDIETAGLAKACSALQLLLHGTNSLLASLASALHEAQVVLAVRLSVRDDDWQKTYSLIDSWQQQEGARLNEELLLVRDMCRWHDLQAQLGLFFSDQHVRPGTAQYSGLLLKIPHVEDLLRRFDQLLDCSSALLPAVGTPFVEQEQARAQRDTVAALLNLLKALCDSNFDEELVATGHFESSSCPLLKDELLMCFFDFVRQHEVSVRLQDVHRQLELLGLSQRRSLEPLRRLLLQLKDSAAGQVEPAKTTTRRRVTVIGADGSAAAAAASAAASAAVPASRNRRSSIGQVASRQGAGKRGSRAGGRKKSVHIFSSALSVASVLGSTDWSSFPAAVRSLFETARSDLIDRVIRCRLGYACSDCRVSLDARGLVCIPSYASQLLETVLYDTRRCVRLAARFGCTLVWREETSQMMLSAHTVMTYRTLFIENNLEALVGELRVLRVTDSLALSPLVAEEVGVIERFCAEHVAASAITACLRLLTRGPAEQSRFDSSTFAAAEVRAVQALLRGEARESAYHHSLLRLARALYRAVQLSALHEGDEESMSQVQEEALQAAQGEALAAEEELLPLLQEALQRLRANMLPQAPAAPSTEPAPPAAGTAAAIKELSDVFSEIAGVSLEPGSPPLVSPAALERLADCTKGMCVAGGFAESQPLWAVAALTVQITLESDLDGAAGPRSSSHLRVITLRNSVAEFLAPFRVNSVFREPPEHGAYEPEPPRNPNPTLFDVALLLQSLKTSAGDAGSLVGEAELAELDRRHGQGVRDVLARVHSKLAEMLAALGEASRDEGPAQRLFAQRKKTVSLLRGLKLSIGC